MPDATHRTAHWVESEEEAEQLAAAVTDPERTRLIIGITTRPALERPWIDADALAERLGDRADVWVLTDSGHTWALTEALPPRVDVYGGAVRAWRPMVPGEDPYPSDHPQWTIFSEGEAAKVTEQLIAYVDMLDDPPPAYGSEATATVTAVRKAGAELELAGGHPAFASSNHLLRAGDVFHAGEVLVPGQEVRVRVGAWHPAAGRVSVSLREFAPDPWDRLEEVYEPGDLVDGIVSEVKHFGAFVELLPGAEGLLHKSKISRDFVEYVDDYVRPGDRVTVRLLSVDVGRRKAEVSMVDAPAGEAPEPPAAIFDGGPPWIPDSPDAFEDPAPEPTPAPVEVVPADEPEPRGPQPESAPQPEAHEDEAESAQTDPGASPTKGRFADALALMMELHGDQVRKDPERTPYVAHLMSVSALVLEHGGNEDDAIAGLLHDAIEDAGGVPTEQRIALQFGADVARIVRDVSDTDEDPKPPWRARKEAYLRHLAGVDERALRVSAADKLHNARALLTDHRRVGAALWDRFNAGRDEQLWVYEAYGEAFERRLAELGAATGPTAELVAELRATTAALAAEVALEPVEAAVAARSGESVDDPEAPEVDGAAPEIRPDLRTVFGFGVAGNFAGHLEQAGEARDFVGIGIEGVEAPKGIFPWYVPEGGGDGVVPEFLHTFPISAVTVARPAISAVNLQIEPEVGLLAAVEYGEAGEVVALHPEAIGAFNDCSIRRDGAAKISHKKNWGAASKGLAARLLPIADLNPDGPTATFRLACFLRRGGETQPYGIDSALPDYTYYGQRLLSWIVDRLNHQEGAPGTPLEAVGSYLRAAGNPDRVLVGIGATRYTEVGESTYLELGDDAIVIVYDSSVTSPEALAEAVAAGTEAELPSASVLRQRVVAGGAPPELS